MKQSARAHDESAKNLIKEMEQQRQQDREENNRLRQLLTDAAGRAEQAHAAAKREGQQREQHMQRELEEERRSCAARVAAVQVCNFVPVSKHVCTSHQSASTFAMRHAMRVSEGVARTVLRYIYLYPCVCMCR